MKLILFLFVCAAAAWPAVAGAQEAPSPWFARISDAPLIYIDDTVLTVGRLEQYLLLSGTDPGGNRQRALDTLESTLEALIDETVIILDLDSAAILADRETARRGRWRASSVAGNIIFDSLIAPHVHIEDSVIEQYYRDSLASRYTAPRRRELRQILIAPRSETPHGEKVPALEARRRAKDAAESLLVHIQAGAPFDSVARLFSDDEASRVNDGYLGWVFPGNTPADFDSAAFGGEVGDVRGPVRTTYGYHLIKIENERPESTVALTDEIKYSIWYDLALAEGRRLGNVWADSVIQATDWKYNDALLGKPLDATEKRWVAVANDRDSLHYNAWMNAWIRHKQSLGIEDEGTLEQKYHSARLTLFPILYTQIAEDLGYANHPGMTAQWQRFIRSEALRLARARLRELQEPPELPRYSDTLSTPEIKRPLHLQMVRARDTASIWAAYRSLVAGRDMATVARWYHDNLRDIRSRAWDLGWVGREDLPAKLWGTAWILNVGSYSRPVEYDSSYYIFKVVDRKQTGLSQQDIVRQQTAVQKEWRLKGLAQWRKQIREGHRIRINRSYWQRVQQLWRP